MIGISLSLSFGRWGGVGVLTYDALVTEDGSYLVTEGGRPFLSLTPLSPITGDIYEERALTIRGSGFNGATTVTIGGLAVGNLVVVNGSTLTCTAPVGTPGTASMVVTTGAQVETYPAIFTFTQIAQTLIYPSTVAKEGGTPITILGTGFRTGMMFYILGDTHAGQAMTVAADGRSATVTVAFPSNETPGTYAVDLVNPSPGSSLHSLAAITVV